MLPSSSRLPPLSSLGGFFADPVSSAVSLLLLVVVQVPTPCPQPCPGGPWWHLCSADPPQLLWPSGLTHTFPKRSRWLMSALRRRNRICLSCSHLCLGDPLSLQNSPLFSPAPQSGYPCHPCTCSVQIEVIIHPRKTKSAG